MPSFSLVFVVALLASANAAAGQRLASGWSSGMRWSQIAGWRTAPCKKGFINCQGPIVRFPTIGGCAAACARSKTCRCAVYSRKHNGRCSMKNFPCNRSPVVLVNDKTATAVSINVFRPGPLPKPIYRPGPNPGPKPAPKPAPRPRPPARDGADPVGATYRATMTQFSGFGEPYGGCGVPMSDMKDDNGKALPFIALNWKSPSGGMGMFGNGGNCGRWVKIKIGKACGGGNRGDNIPSCLANYDGGEMTPQTGEEIYGYVGDMCADSSNWCSQDAYHVDLSYAHLSASGLARDWRNNKISWTFLDGTPPGWSQQRNNWRWCANSKWLWLCIIITNVDNGLDRIEVLTKNGWARGSQNWLLGQQWNLPAADSLVRTNGKFNVRAFDINGKMYPPVLVHPPTGSNRVTDAM